MNINRARKIAHRELSDIYSVRSYEPDKFRVQLHTPTGPIYYIVPHSEGKVKIGTGYQMWIVPIS